MNITLFTPYHAVCWRDGHIIWEDDFHNLVTTAGLNKAMDALFKTGIASPAWYLGLVDNAGFSAYSASDTLVSHAGWAETSAYTGNRKAFVPGSISAGSVSNSSNPAPFVMNGTVTVRGSFLCDAATGSSGTLYGVGNFTGGNRSVTAGDVIVVTSTPSAS